MTTTTKRLRDLDAATEALLGHRAPEGSCYQRGWCLDGAGPARYGWFLRCASGRQIYLGRSVDAVRARAAERLRREVQQ